MKKRIEASDGDGASSANDDDMRAIIKATHTIFVIRRARSDVFELVLGSIVHSKSLLKSWHQ